MLVKRVAMHLENPEKSGNLTLVREKSGKLGRVSRIVVYLWYGTADFAILSK